MVIYGSYLPTNISLVKSALLISFFDTLIALMACMMMYPIIFGSEMELSESASMLFTSLTVQFHTLPGGQFVSALFYLLVAVAALSSTISLLEIVVSFIAEEWNFNRRNAEFFRSRPYLVCRNFQCLEQWCKQCLNQHWSHG